MSEAPRLKITEVRAVGDDWRITAIPCRRPAYNAWLATRSPVPEEDTMFTGIIESIGTIRSLTPKGGDVRVYVETGKLDLADVKLGDSIAVNGVCLTAVELPGDGFWADVSVETLKRTAMVDLKSGSRVSTEKP